MLAAAKTNLKLRYSLLKYFYHLFVTKRGLGTIWKPLFFEYPTDQNVYLDDITDTQFLIGNNLLAAPIVEEGKTSRKVYFPSTNWINLETGKKYSPGTDVITDVKLTSQVPLFLKEGSIIHTQDTEKVVNTKQLDNKFLLSTGLRFDTRRSNSTHQYYESTGNMLSINNYHNDSLIDLCEREGC